MPWLRDGRPVYEDWYLVGDFAALGRLNEAAVAAGHRLLHDAAAQRAAGGAGGLYALRRGTAALPGDRCAWFAKPAGWSYERLDAGVDVPEGGALWQRQLVLGPAPELCLAGGATPELDGADDVIVPPRRMVGATA